MTALRFIKPPSAARTRGLTLIEILVTLVVLSIGLLGVAALQIYSLQSSQVSAQRTIALNLAAKITDDWRSNRSLCTGAGAQLPTTIRSTWDRFFESDDGAVTLLPGGSATAVCDANQVVTVTVRWPSGRFDEEFADGDSDREDEVVLVTRI